MRMIQSVTAALLSLCTSLALAGEFGDHCTTSLSSGQMIKTDCSINTQFSGKTYCFGSNESKSAFLMHPEESIAKAAAFYAQHSEIERVKISQEEAIKQIHSPTCDLSNRDAGYLELDGMDLHHCKMVNTSFFGAYLRGANLSGANLQRAYLNLARLEKADLSNADLTDATIFQAIFDKTNFQGANLTHARVIGTLGNVNMSGATIRNGQFGLDVGNQPMGQMKFDSVGGNFAHANFEGADLNIASFRFANLTGANLRNTNLYRADLGQADLTGADLTGAKLDSADIDGATFKDAKGLETVKGFDMVKGKCIDCSISPAAVSQ
jgi:uncharacterized protein YjbI with pentapeptide repeats